LSKKKDVLSSPLKNPRRFHPAGFCSSALTA